MVRLTVLDEVRNAGEGRAAVHAHLQHGLLLLLLLWLRLRRLRRRAGARLGWAGDRSRS